MARARVEALEAELSGQARAWAELLHLVSHELRTPITVILGFTRLLEDTSHGPLNAKQAQFVTEALKACRRLDGFVGDLLEAGPDGSRVLSVDRKPAHLQRTIRSVVDSLWPMIEARALQLELELDDSIDAFAFDSVRVGQVLTNLLTNAIRHGRGGGLLRIGTRCVRAGGDSIVCVSVEDDGPGVREVDRARIFEPYVRQSCEGSEGLGIGLTICRRIVNAHGGSIAVEAGMLGGARFVFTLPYVPCTGEEE